MHKTNETFDVRVKIKKVTFSSKDNFFKLLKVGILNQNNTSGGEEFLDASETLAADLPIASVGDVFECSIKVTYTEKYGYRLDMIGQPREVAPANESEMSKYLSRKLKGVGKKSADKLVDAFGMDVIRTIEQRGVDALTGIGFSNLKATAIVNQIEGQHAFSRLNEFLFTFNIPVAVTIAVYETLGMEALNEIRKNPYTICRNVKIVPFFYADVVAQETGRRVTDEHRIDSAILEYIQRRVDNRGDVFVLRDEVMTELHDYLDYEGDFLEEDNLKVTIKHIDDSLFRLKQDEDIVIEKDDEGNDNIYLTPFAKIENNIVKNVNRLIDKQLPLVGNPETINSYLNDVEASSFPLATKQREAIEQALTNNMMILTGGPGTGKTHTTNMIVNTLMHVNPNAQVALLAPTGKASKRLSELTKMDAMTIHRKLKIYDDTDADEYETIEEDFVVVDETSMVDAVIFNKLMNNLGDNTRLLLVGDVEQLPSIGAGLILNDLIESGRIPVVQLTEVFRQAQDSQIITNAHKLIKGMKKDEEDGLTIDNTKGDMYWMERTNEEDIRDLILYSVKTQIEKYGHKLEDIVVLSPMRKRELGTIRLNSDLQAMLNPPCKGKEEITTEREEPVTFRKGDRVIHLTNNLEKGVTNGEMGTITGIYSELTTNEYTGATTNQDIVEVDYAADKSVKYTAKELDEIELAYAMTIHKSQGSEFPVVVMPIHHSHANMLQRNLIYTAWTRAKSKLILAGETAALNMSIDNTDNLNRHTRLCEKLKDSHSLIKA